VTPAEKAAWIAALSVDDLISILRADPDRAAAAIERAKVAGAWDDDDRPCWGGLAALVGPNSDRAHMDAFLLARGWVLAKGGGS